MISLTIAKKYAKALLEVGLKDGNYETLGQDLNKMADLLKESKELRVALWSPAFPKPTRKAIGRKIGERLGLATATIEFIELLIQKKRIDLFFEIRRNARLLHHPENHRSQQTGTSEHGDAFKDLFVPAGKSTGKPVERKGTQNAENHSGGNAQIHACIIGRLF